MSDNLTFVDSPSRVLRDLTLPTPSIQSTVVNIAVEGKSATAIPYADPEDNPVE